MGVELLVGDPRDEICGENIILPREPGLINALDLDMNKLKKSYMKNVTEKAVELTEQDIQFLADDTNSDVAFVVSTLKELSRRSS